MRLRHARLEDAPALLALKHALRLEPERSPARGGFLLGTSLEHYRHFIAHDWVLLAEEEGVLQGFAIVLAHETFVLSAAWQKGDTVRWAVPPETFGTRLAYFEQLAFLPRPGARTYAKYVSFLSAQSALETHDGLFTTVVRKPVHNRAVLPFLRVTGFERVGEIDEHYPEVDAVLSDIYYLSRAAFERRLEAPEFRRFLPRAAVWLPDVHSR